MLFLSGDAGDGCYRIDEGLLKVSVVAPTGGERILAMLGPGGMVGELSMIDRRAALGLGGGVARFQAELRQPGRRSRPIGRDNPDMYQHLMLLLAAPAAPTPIARWPRPPSCRCRGASRAPCSSLAEALRP